VSKPAQAYIGLGSNLGDRLDHLNRATGEIGRRVGRITGQSSVYVSPPWGFEAKEDFYNTVICVETVQTPEELLKNLHLIEQEMGRVRSDSANYQSRNIDLDIIDFDGRVKSTATPILPHPLMHRRTFVLAPLSEINPRWIHPVLKRTAGDLLLSLESHDDIRILKGAND
jgi:2-amino-4-hydroxy-6-hydroxymethyldihydropteridine diphosphokinase